MTQPFVPANDLERALLAAQQNLLPVTAFVQTFHDSRVYLLVDRTPGPGGVRDKSANAMVLANPEKTPFLAVFTAPERYAEWAKRQTTFGFGASTDVAGLLKDMAPDQGIVINPGLPVGFEMQPATVAQLRAQAR